MTEQEAKNLWCPFTRQMSVHGGVAINRASSREPVGTCIGSQCMAWRMFPDEDRWGAKIDQGYCGLAGVPQT